MCVCCCFFETLLKAFNFSSFQSSAELNIAQTSILTDPKEKGQSHLFQPGAHVHGHAHKHTEMHTNTHRHTRTHTGLREALQEERLQDGPTQAQNFCKHTMPFLLLQFHSLSFLILVSDQKKTEQQATCLGREYLDFHAHIARN